MATFGKGRAVQVVRPKEGNSFEVDECALKNILLDERIRDSKVMILSIVGAFRGGKSFLLNFFIRYLCSTGSDDWMGNSNEPLLGFFWKGGSKRVTSGIFLWSEPFFMSLPSGEKVCILLMDTQGSFDSHSTVKECATIFALSTLISSVQIYNISSNLKEDDLQHLEFFIEYGKLALESYDDKPFQDLYFLVRDWQYCYNFPYGAEGGMEFMRKKLEIKEGQAPELQNLRRHLSQCFKKLKCFLMPHPGLKVATTDDFRGSILGCV